MQKIKYLTLFLVILLAFACKKENTLQETPKVVRVQIKGYVMTDTLEFVTNGIITGTAINNLFTIPADASGTGTLYKAGDEILVRKKADGSMVSIISVEESPFKQVKKIFYDGASLSDNLVLTPVSDPNNMGFRLQFSTSFADFYGGPVDVELFEEVTIRTPRSTTYRSVKLIKDITRKFGDFIELSPLTVETGKTKRYAFKVYKANTTELPYSKMDNVSIPSPNTNYGFIGQFVSGESMLISISPATQGGGARVSAGYQVSDFAYAFK